MTELDGAALAELFETCQTAWRWEAQPTYTMEREQPTLARFLAGEPKPQDHNAAWRRKVTAWTADGKQIARVRVLSRPLTDYQRYQLAWGIPGNMAAGEDVRIYDRDQIPDGVVPQQDFWLFGDHSGESAVVVVLNFDPVGRLLNRVRVAEAELVQYRTWQQVAVTASIPLAEWDARP